MQNEDFASGSSQQEDREAHIERHPDRSNTEDALTDTTSVSSADEQSTAVDPVQENAMPSEQASSGKTSRTEIKLEEDASPGSSAAKPQPRAGFFSELTRYSDIRYMGEGSFGEVYRATDTVLQRPVAIKVLKQNVPNEIAEQFQQEARRLASLDHPNICKIFDFGSAGGRSYLVTEWLAGRSLASASLPMEIRQACEIVANVVEAMAFAHSKDVIHRDLKPANLMMDAHGRVRVIDFGMAIYEDELTSGQRDFSGSPAYMAPEQIEGHLHVLDGRVDVWAMGVILFELITGKRPFRAKHLSDVLSKIRDKPATSPRTFNAEVPPAVERIILRCLAKPPAERFATADDLAVQLRQFLATSQATGSHFGGNSPNPGQESFSESSQSATAKLVPPPQPEPSPKHSVARTAGVILLAGVVLFGVILAGSALVSSNRPRGGHEASSIASNATEPFGEQAATSPVTEQVTQPSKDVFSVQGTRSAAGTSHQGGLAWSLSTDRPDSPNIRVGDRITLSVRLHQPRHVYLIWIGTDTGITTLYPGPLGSTENIGDPQADFPIESLTLPVGTLTATPSTETVLMIASQSPFESPAQFKQVLKLLPKPDISRLVSSGQFRGIHFDADRHPNSPAADPLGRTEFEPTIAYLQEQLGESLVTQAVCFCSGQQ